MIRVQRTESRESVVHHQRHFSLVSWTWTVSVGGPGFGMGWRYQHPHRIESAVGSKPVTDFVFLARVGAALLLAAVALVQRRSHD